MDTWADGGMRSLRHFQNKKAVPPSLLRGTGPLLKVEDGKQLAAPELCDADACTPAPRTASSPPQRSHAATLVLQRGVCGTAPRAQAGFRAVAS